MPHSPPPVRVTIAPGEDVGLARGQRFADLRKSLATVLGRAELATDTLFVGSTLIDDDALAGLPPLVTGAVLTPAPVSDDVLSLASAADDAPWQVRVLTGPDSGWTLPLNHGQRLQIGGSFQVRLGRSRLARWPRLARFGARPRLRGIAPRGRRSPRRFRTARPFRVDGAEFLVHRTGTSPKAPRKRGGADAARGHPFGGEPQVKETRPRSGRAVITFLVPAAFSLLLALTLRQPIFALMALSGPLALLLGRFGRRGPTGEQSVTASPLRPGERRGTPRSPARPGPSTPATGGSRTTLEVDTASVPPNLLLDPQALVHEIRAGRAPATPSEPADDSEQVLHGRPCAIAVVGAHPIAQARLWICAYAAAGFRIQILGDGGQHNLRWTRWLPTFTPSALEHPELEFPENGPGSPSAHTAARDAPVLAVAVGPAQGGWLPDLSRWWAQSHPTSHLLVVSDDGVRGTGAVPVPSHPAWCTGVDLGSGLSEQVADRLARALAAQASQSGHHPGSGRLLPTRVPLVSLLGAPALTPSTTAPTADAKSADHSVDAGEQLRKWLAGRWESPPPGLRAVLGLGEAGQPMTVDLPFDGPHGLIAGTTGAGKSELLQTLICSLAMTYPPRDVAFALIDYKGGASFGACAHLPHVVGQVTDLDPGLAQRALTGLRAELTRREHLLAEHGVPSLDALREKVGSHTTPRLVIVVDEFRALADQLPDFLPGLLRIAAQGRSLGIHLILATQRPGGVVTADMRANIGLRIALRVTDPAESRDILDVPDAAQLPAEAPGRAVLVTTTMPHRTLQSALASGAHLDGVSLVSRVADPAMPNPVRTRPVPEAPSLRSIPDHRRPTPNPQQQAGTLRSVLERDASSPDALEMLVEAARNAHTRSGVPLPQPVWLPALPTSVALPAANRTPVVEGLTVGLLDVPTEQRRDWATWDLSRGHLVVEGNARSGRSTALLTLARDALGRGMQVHVVARSWVSSQLGKQPLLGTVIPPDEPRRICELLRMLSAQHPSGSSLPGSARTDEGSSSQKHRDGADPIAQVVLIDDLEEVLAGLGQIARGAGVDVLLALLRRPATHGVHIALASAQALPSALRSVVTHQLVLAGTKHDDAARGVPSSLAGQIDAPGRGFWFMGGSVLVCQVARAAPCADPAPLTSLVGPGPSPRRILPIPERVTTAEVTSHPEEGLIAIGRGGSTAETQFLDVTRGALIVGPNGSGRSSLLTHLASELTAEGSRPTLIIARDGPLLEAPATLRVTTFTPQSLTSAFEAMDGLAVNGPWTILLDDGEALTQVCPLESEHLMTEGAGVRPARILIAAAATPSAANAFRGPLATLRAQRRGFVLDPGSPASADVFGAPLVWLTDPGPCPAGRGVLVHGRTQILVQVAHPNGGVSPRT